MFDVPLYAFKKMGFDSKQQQLIRHFPSTLILKLVQQTPIQK